MTASALEAMDEMMVTGTVWLGYKLSWSMEGLALK